MTMKLSRHTLSNHLRVVILELPHVHSVELGLFVKAGPRFETPRTLGISHFVEHMMFKGTRTRPDTLQLHAAMERLGSPVSALTSRDYCQYYLTVPPRNLAMAAELFAEIMTNPTFEGIETERQIILEERLGDLNESGQDITPESHARAMLWPGTPLGLSILGTEKNIRRFTQQDLQRHHARQYVGACCVLYLAGRVSEAEGLALAERTFAQLPAGEPLLSPETQHLEEGPKLEVVPNDDSQVHLSLSFRAPAFTAEEYLPAVLLQNVLTDGIASRLQWHLCERLGLVYDLDAGMECFYDTGVFDIDASVEGSKLVTLVQEILGVLTALREEPISAEERLRAVERYQMSFEFALDNPGALASWLLAMELYNRPPQMEALLERMQRLTPEEVQTVARKIFAPEHLVMVLSGNIGKPQRKQLQSVLDQLRVRWQPSPRLA